MSSSDTLELFPPFSLDSNRNDTVCFVDLPEEVDLDGPNVKAGTYFFHQLHSIVLNFRL